MPDFTFKPIIRHGQSDALPYSQYGIVPPKGLERRDIRVPTYITPTNMVAKTRPLESQTAGLGIVHGLTVADVSALRDTPTHYGSLSAAINAIRAAATNQR